jgi:hypothetical protein
VTPERKAAVVVTLIIVVLALIYSAERYRLNKNFNAEHPLSLMAEKINAGSHREWCDDQVDAHRRYVTAVMDRFRPQIKGLWQSRDQKPGEAVPTISIGKILLRISQPEKHDPTNPWREFDDSSWSWEEAYGLIKKTQDDFLNPSALRLAWRDADSISLYLLEKDYARAQLGRKFETPELTEHQFRSNPAVLRTGPKEFTVLLDAGEFAGYEKVLEKILSDEWRGLGYSVKIRWVKANELAYRFEANLSSGRTYVNHARHAIVLENLAWTKTVAHEFGHVLGFDDHYYSVWDSQHCYYTQKARNSDLMSNSQRGGITARHWELLDQAYPLNNKNRGSFAYIFNAKKN